MIELLSFLATRRAKAAKKGTIKKKHSTKRKMCANARIYESVPNKRKKKTEEKKSDVKLSLPGFM